MRNLISDVIARHRFHKTFPRRGTQLRVSFSQLFMTVHAQKERKKKETTISTTRDQSVQHHLRAAINLRNSQTNNLKPDRPSTFQSAGFACYNRATRSRAIFSSAVAKEVRTKVPRYGLKQKGH